jgi:hypothetical protein
MRPKWIVLCFVWLIGWALPQYAQAVIISSHRELVQNYATIDILRDLTLCVTSEILANPVTKDVTDITDVQVTAVTPLNLLCSKTMSLYGNPGQSINAYTVLLLNGRPIDTSVNTNTWCLPLTPGTYGVRTGDAKIALQVSVPKDDFMNIPAGVYTGEITLTVTQP